MPTVGDCINRMALLLRDNGKDGTPLYSRFSAQHYILYVKMACTRQYKANRACFFGIDNVAGKIDALNSLDDLLPIISSEFLDNIVFEACGIGETSNEPGARAALNEQVQREQSATENA